MIDIHNHTIFSDGKDSMADVIQAAVERELKVVGISDHFDPYLLRQDVCLQPEGVNSYLREIERLKGSYPITVLSGLELGLQSTGISWPVGDFNYYIYSVPHSSRFSRSERYGRSMGHIPRRGGHGCGAYR
jgi:histidinol-phosphatase (PHP family)